MNTTSFHPEMLLSYPLFEDDQVLTSEHLNHLQRHADDQDRFTRVRFLGVGIVTGLQVKLIDGPEIFLSEGLGVTTNGSIALLPTTVYGRYRPLSAAMDPNGQFQGAWELIPNSTDEPSATSLQDFERETGKSFSELSAVVQIEMREEGSGYCSGTDCDSRGKTGLTKTHLLLVEASQIEGLRAEPRGPVALREKFTRVEIPRVPLVAAITSHDHLVGLYRASASSLYAALATAFTSFRQEISGSSGRPALDYEIQNDFSWLERLDVLQNDWSTNAGLGIQYYFAFLSDLAETYNEILDLLQQDLTWRNPAPEAFPHHLVLGSVTPNCIDRSRTPFFPSPVTSHSVERADHVRFLLNKLGVLVCAFDPQKGEDVAEDVRITPSRSIDAPLEDRAAPWYYKHHPGDPNPVYSAWNYSRWRSGREKTIPGYHAREYGGEGIAADPFRHALSRFSFFRTEGYLGLFAADVVKQLRRMARQHNLPILIRQAVLADRPAKVTSDVVTPPDSERSGSESRLQLNENDKSHFLLTTFLNEYSGLEHSGGVERGGTLLILSTEDGQTVGDLSFPFACSWPDPTQHNDPLGPVTPSSAPVTPPRPNTPVAPLPSPEASPIEPAGAHFARPETSRLRPTREPDTPIESIQEEYQQELTHNLSRLREIKTTLLHLKNRTQTASVLESFSTCEKTFRSLIEGMIQLVQERGGDLSPSAPVGQALQQARQTIEELDTPTARECVQQIDRLVSTG